MAAYSFVMVCIFIVAAALIFAYCTPAINKITEIAVNPYIDQHILSERSVWVYQWNVNFFSAIPGLGLIGFAIALVVRSIEVSEAGGG